MSLTILPPDIASELYIHLPIFVADLPADVSPVRFRSIVETAIANNSDLAKAEPQSLWNACAKAAQDGLMPDGREGALVTFFDRRKNCVLAQWMPMIGGIIKKVKQKGGVTSLMSAVVYEGENFRVLLGEDDRIEHERDIGAPGHRDPIAVYAIATLADGTKEKEVMSWAQVQDVKSASRSPDRGPWSTWGEEMARKTVVRRLAKRLPVLEDDARRVIERVDENYDFGRPAPAGPALAAPQPQGAIAPPSMNLPRLARDGRLVHSPNTKEWAAGCAATVKALESGNAIGQWKRDMEPHIADVSLIQAEAAQFVRDAIDAALDAAAGDEQPGEHDDARDPMEDSGRG